MKETGEIAKALAAFQAEMPTVAKGKTADTGAYKYAYADLADVSAAAAPLLTKQGLAFSCCPRRTEAGWEARGILLHTSGQRLTASLPIGGNTAQALGSSLTYARRYLYGSMTGLVTEKDDDGAAASKAPAKKAARVKATPADDPWQDTPPREPGDRQVSGDQLKKIGAQMRELNITDRKAALLYVKDVIGREVESRNDLTRSEASKVIEALIKDAEQPFPSEEPGS
jgi:hypothetical protein